MSPSVIGSIGRSKRDIRSNRQQSVQRRAAVASTSGTTMTFRRNGFGLSQMLERRTCRVVGQQIGKCWANGSICCSGPVPSDMIDRSICGAQTPGNMVALLD